MLRSLRFRLPALFLLGILFAGIVATLTGTGFPANTPVTVGIALLVVLVVVLMVRPRGIFVGPAERQA